MVFKILYNLNDTKFKTEKCSWIYVLCNKYTLCSTNNYRFIMKYNSGLYGMPYKWSANKGQRDQKWLILYVGPVVRQNTEWMNESCKDSAHCTWSQLWLQFRTLSTVLCWKRRTYSDGFATKIHSQSLCYGFGLILSKRSSFSSFLVPREDENRSGLLFCGF